MTTIKELQNMSQVDITSYDMTKLVELSDVKIDRNLPVGERLESLIQQIKNPYCFLCNGIPVKLTYSPTGPTFEQALSDYLLRLKSQNIR